MPDDAEKAATDALESKAADLIKSDDEADESEEDDSAKDSEQDSGPDPDDSDDSEEEASDDSDEEDSNEDSSDEEEPDFGFRDLPTNAKNFVVKLEKMSPEKRKETIEGLDPKRNKTELDAAKQRFPDDFSEPEKVEVPKEKMEQIEKLLEKFGDPEKVESAMKTLDELNKRAPQLETQLIDRMLKDKYGDEFDSVKEDPKFQKALEQYGKLDLPDRLEAASMASKVARGILIEKAAQKQNSQKALAKRKAGSSKTKKEKTERKHSIFEPEGVEERFGSRLD